MRVGRRIINTVVTPEVIVKQQHFHSFFLRVFAVAAAWSALASYSAAQAGAPPDVTVAVHATHYALAGRAFDDPEKLSAAIDSMSPRSVGIVACGPGSTRPLMAAAYRLRARPLYLRVHESNETACAMQGALALTVGQRTSRVDEEAAVDRYWRSIAP
jgi:hypothetical protein